MLFTQEEPEDKQPPGEEDKPNEDTAHVTDQAGKTEHNAAEAQQEESAKDAAGQNDNQEVRTLGWTYW